MRTTVYVFSLPSLYFEPKLQPATNCLGKLYEPFYWPTQGYQINLPVKSPVLCLRLLTPQQDSRQELNLLLSMSTDIQKPACTGKNKVRLYNYKIFFLLCKLKWERWNCLLSRTFICRVVILIYLLV